MMHTDTSTGAVRNQNNVCKVIVLGDSNVGKTSLLYRYCEREIAQGPIVTVGVDYFNTTVEVEGRILQLQLWDTAGLEKYHDSMTSHYYRKVDGVIFVYDVTNANSFRHVTKWVDEFKCSNPSKVPRVLIGNKCDRKWEKTVATKAARVHAEYFEMDLFETSATEFDATEAIDHIFQNLATKICEYKNKNKDTENRLVPYIKLSKSYEPKHEDRTRCLGFSC